MEQDKIWREKKHEEIPSSLRPGELFFGRLKKNNQVLEIGCGVGKLSLYLAGKGYSVNGIDINVESIKMAQKKAKDEYVDNRCCFVEGTAVELPFPEETFDVIVIQATLTVIADVKQRGVILLEASRVLKQGGFLYIGEFMQTRENEYYKKRYIENALITGEMGLFVVYDDQGKELYWAKHFEQQELESMLGKAGFKIETCEMKKFKTRSGNIIDGVEMIASKK